MEFRRRNRKDDYVPETLSESLSSLEGGYRGTWLRVPRKKATDEKKEYEKRPRDMEAAIESTSDKRPRDMEAAIESTSDMGAISGFIKKTDSKLPTTRINTYC
ncbi:hypothetical protein QE152_g25767 [Popillia japonica]|uniref:Uncharacterized protein n=1 Tax=Popillia japonica TaxID=7064 RepID=A0AAW1K0N9_POPJA